jgi:hypothetical protein
LFASAEELNATTESGSENDDPLLELLRSGQALEQLEFLGDLHRQRNSADVNQ